MSEIASAEKPTTAPVTPTLNNKIHINTYSELATPGVIKLENPDIIEYCKNKHIKLLDGNIIELKKIYVKSSYWVCVSEPSLANSPPKLFVLDIDQFIQTGTLMKNAIEFNVYSDQGNSNEIYPGGQSGGSVFSHNVTIKHPSKRYTYKSTQK